MTDSGEFPTWDEVCDIAGTSSTGQAYGLFLLARELHEQNKLRRLELELERGQTEVREAYERLD